MKTTFTSSISSSEILETAPAFLPDRYRALPVPRLLEKDQELVPHRIQGVERLVAQPVTLTPFASAEPCTARCQFCSEALIHKHATRLSAALRPGPRYTDQFRAVLTELRGLPLGLSLSGLEATSNADWLLAVLEAVADHGRRGGLWRERVLYSNGTGLHPRVERSAELLSALERVGLTRIEMSRHSPNSGRNARIMRFRDGIAVGETAAFEETVRFARDRVPVKLVCVIQAGGVDTLETAEAYLNWAADLGIDTVVFRELSRLHDLYRPNAAARYVEAARVPIEPFVDDALKRARGFEPVRVTEGYYYWNIHFLWKNRVTAIFETSDYEIMKTLHRGDVIYKFVFHANGNLCADWDPNTQILMSVPL